MSDRHRSASLMKDLSHTNVPIDKTHSEIQDLWVSNHGNGSTSGLDIAGIDALMHSLAEKKKEIEACDDETQSELLVSFLKQLRSTKQSAVDRLNAELSILNHDIKIIENRRIELGFITRIPSPSPMEFNTHGVFADEGKQAFDTTYDTFCTTMDSTLSAAAVTDR